MQYHSSVVTPATGNKQSIDNVAIKARLIDLLYENVLLQVIVSPIIALCVIWVLIDIYPFLQLLMWFSFILAAFSARYFLYKAYMKAEPKPERAAIWGVYYALLMMTAGMAWGVAAIWFFSVEHPAATMMLVIVLAGLTAGAFISHSSYLPAYIVFPIFAVFPLATQFFVAGGKTNILLGTLCLVYILVLFVYARKAHRYLIMAVEHQIELEKVTEVLEVEKHKAEQANNAKSKFLAVASHDLRQPAHAIQLFVGALEGKVFDRATNDLVSNLQKSSGSLNQLLNNLLDLSRLEASIIKPQFEIISLEDMFLLLRDEYEPKAWGKSLDFRMVPSSAVIRTDPVLFERILRNLLENAIRYTQEGSILLGARKSKEYVRIEVWDTGVGIAEDKLAIIFDEFYQVDEPEYSGSEGLGLGLSIVNRLAALMGTSMRVQSKEGLGSCFSITMPRSYQKKEVLANENAVSSKLNDAAVLVIDDDALIRQAMQALLEGWQCQGIIVESYEEAVNQLQQNNIKLDMIISDYRLRGELRGTDIISRIKEQFGTHIPAILLTGDTGVEILHELDEQDVSVVHKPIKPAKLRLLMEQLVSV